MRETSNKIKSKKKMSSEEVRKAEKELDAQEEAARIARNATVENWTRPHTAWGDFCAGVQDKWESFKSWF